MNFDSIYSSVKDFAVRTADKLSHSADVATLQVKLAMAEKRLDEAYKNLGKLAYRNFSGREDSAEKLQNAMSAVDAVKAEMKALKAQIEQKKREAAEAAQKAREEAAQRNAQGCAQAEAEGTDGVRTCEGDVCPVVTEDVENVEDAEEGCAAEVEDADS